MLTLALGTEEIIRRAAPDDGIDLFLPRERCAFQCKAVEALGGRFRTDDACASLQRALATRERTGWTSYEICSNLDLNANQEVKLRKLFPEIGIRGRSCWQDLCRRHPQVAARFFRPIAPVLDKAVDDALTAPMAIHFTEELRGQLSRDRRRVLFYSHRFDKLYEVPVSGESTTRGVIQQLQALLLLPFTHSDEKNGLFIDIDYALVHEGKRLLGLEMMGELGIRDGSIIGLEVSIHVRDTAGSVERRSMAAFKKPGDLELAPADLRIKLAEQQTENKLVSCFARLDHLLNIERRIPKIPLRTTIA